MASTVDPADSAFYFVYRTDFHDWGFIEEDTFELNIIGEKIAEQFTKKAPQMRLLSESPFPTQEVSFQSERDSAWHFVRIVVDGPHYYMLGCRKKEPIAPELFFNSFSIEPMRYPEGWTQMTDTTLDFTIKTRQTPEKPRKAFMEKLKKIFEEGNRKRYRMYDNEDAYDWSLNGGRVLKSAPHREEVSVRSSDFSNRGTVPTRDSFELDIRKSLTRNNKMALRESKWESVDSMLVGQFLIEDTNSTRASAQKSC